MHGVCAMLGQGGRQVCAEPQVILTGREPAQGSAAGQWDSLHRLAVDGREGCAEPGDPQL